MKEGNKIRCKNGRIFHVTGLEELISSKYPCLPKQFTDSMQSSPKNANVMLTRGH